MSRGRGRGGGGGRGRGPVGTARIAGVDIPYDQELDLNGRPQPTELYPAYKVLPPKALTKDERRQVARFRSLRERIHEGPLYTVLGDNVRISKTQGRANSASAQFDPFEGMPTYSQRYTKKRRKIPKLDTRPYVLSFFPQELWSTLDPSHASTTSDTTESRPKKLLFGTSKRSLGLSAFDRELSGEPSRAANGEDEDEVADPVDEDELPPEEEMDDEFSDDEDDMAGDYNAEQYFDDGGDDAGDDYDGGENDGNEYD
ncbi:hypothetical protein MMC19_003969 [Ptychographa xylographoides]|nr:hypothetical protein [Ptychographa xylographoides]